MRRFLAASAVLLGAALTFAVPGHAFADEEPSVRVSPSVVKPGGLITATATCGNKTGFDTAERVSLTALNIAEFVNNQAQLPRNAAEGAYTVKLVCKYSLSTDKDKAPVTDSAEATFRVDHDGRDRDDRDNFDRNRGCSELRDARDRLRDARNDLIRENNEAREEGSPDGRNLSPAELSEIRRLAGIVRDRERDFDREVREASNRCDAADDDVPVADPVIPEININVTVPPSAAPAPSTGGSVASNAPSVGAAETGEPPAEDTATTVAINTAVIANSVVWVGASAKVFVDLGGLK